MGKDGRVGFLIVLVVAIGGVVWWMQGENPDPVNFTPDEPVAEGEGSSASVDTPLEYDAFRDAPRAAESSDPGMPASIPSATLSGDIEIGAPDESTTTTDTAVTPVTATPTARDMPRSAAKPSAPAPETLPTAVTPSEPVDSAHDISVDATVTTAGTSALVSTGPKTHVVQPGEYLSTISREHYGTVNKWKLIADANQDLLKGDHHRLAVGMKLVIPALTQDKTVKAKTIVNDLAKQPKQANLKPGEDSYVIQPGDSLYKIATRQYGNGSLYKKLYNANTDVLNSETDLVVGTKIRLPDFSQDPNLSAPAPSASAAKKDPAPSSDHIDDLPVGLPPSEADPSPAPSPKPSLLQNKAEALRKEL